MPVTEALAGAPLPGIAENIAAGGVDRYLFAPLQGLGVVGDTAYGIPAVGAGIAGLLKAPGALAAIAGIGKASKSGKPKNLPIEDRMVEFTFNKEITDALDPISFDLEDLDIDIDKLTEVQTNYRADKYNPRERYKIDLNIDDIDQIKDWVGGDLSKKKAGSLDFINDINPFIDTLENSGLSLNSQQYLQRFANKDGKIKVYRYLNLGKGGGKKLQTETGIASTTIDPNHAVDQGLRERVKEIYTTTDDYVAPDMFAGNFEKAAAQEKALKEGTAKLEKLVRDTFVVEYDIPLDRVKAYVPALRASISNSAKDRYVTDLAENNYSMTIDEKIENLADYEELDISDISRDDAIQEVIYEQELLEDLDFDLLPADEYEVIADLADLKPTATYNIDADGTIKSTTPISKLESSGKLREARFKKIKEKRALKKLGEEYKDIYKKFSPEKLSAGLTPSENAAYTKMLTNHAKNKYYFVKNYEIVGTPDNIKNKDFVSPEILITAIKDTQKSQPIFIANEVDISRAVRGDISELEKMIQGDVYRVDAYKLYKNFNDTRGKLKEFYGDNIVLNRLENNPNATPGLLTKWLPEGELLNQFKKEPFYANAQLQTKSIPIDDILGITAEPLTNTRGKGYFEVLVMNDEAKQLVEKAKPETIEATIGEFKPIN